MLQNRGAAERPAARMGSIDAVMPASRPRTDLRRRPLLVAATGWGGEADRDRAFAAGFDRHLTKPIEVDALQQIASSLE
jgi:CheY-like chemotaxis protein